jgi:hypothetical protein
MSVAVTAGRVTITSDLTYSQTKLFSSWSHCTAVSYQSTDLRNHNSQRMIYQRHREAVAEIQATLTDDALDLKWIERYSCTWDFKCLILFKLKFYVSAIRFSMKMKGTRSSEMLISCQNTTRRHNPKSWNLLLRSGYEWTGDDNNLGENNHHNDDSDHILKKTKII